MRFKLFQILIGLLLFSCTERKSSPATDAIYADYTITAAEDAENVTCVFRFYNGGSEEETLILEPPSAVLLDGTPVSVDSAGLSGAYYEVQRPVASFAGRHTILFKNAEGKPFTETFTFQAFSIAGALDETVPRSDLSIRLNGLPEGTPLRVSLIDTAFSTPDINDIDTVRNGNLIITKEALRNVISGPVTLHLYHEEERRLQHPPGAGGKLSITYGLSREFELLN